MRPGRRGAGPGAGATWSSARLLEPAAAAGLAGGAVLLARAVGLLQGGVALAALLVLLIALPTSRELSRRVLLVGVLFLGWVPVLWWAPVPVELGRAALVTAAMAGVLAAWVFRGPGRVARATRLVPRVRAVDALPVGAGLVAAIVVRPWLAVPSADAALSMLMRGWDHSAHYDIVHMLRSHGVVIGALDPAILGDAWSYGRYPQGFHAVAATVMELHAGPGVGDPQQEVLLYAQTLGVLSVASIVIVTAGLCAVPRIRRRPLLAAPAVAVVAGAFLLGPGALLLADGFPNFAVATVLLSCLPLLVVPLDKGPLPLHLAAIGGALVGIAHGWVLLLAMALPAVVLLLLPGRRHRFLATRAAWLASGAIILATAFGVSVAVVMVAGQPVSDVLVIPGAISAPAVRLLIGPAALAVAVCIAVLVRLRLSRRNGTRDMIRMATLAGVPLVGLVCAAAIAELQLTAVGLLGYYFWKFAIALALISLVIVAMGAAWLVPRRVGTWTSSPRPLLLAAGVTLAATQMYGLVIPSSLRFGLDWVSPALGERAALDAAAAAPSPVVAQLWAAADASSGAPGRHVFLGYPPGTEGHPVAAGQWYNALTGRWTDQSNEVLKMLFAPMGTTQEVAAVAQDVLRTDAQNVVVVDPRVLAELHELVEPDDLDRRLVAW